VPEFARALLETARSGGYDERYVTRPDPLQGETTMALVHYVSNEEAAEKVRPILEGLEKKLGSVPNVFRAMAHSPELFEAFLALNSALGKTQLDGKLRELAYIKASELNDCDYCLHYHRASGKRAGLSERQVNETGTFETSDAYDDLQRDVLRYAEEVTRHINVSDALSDRLHQSLSDREFVELAMAVGIANFTNRVTETLRMELP
jgi:uncharacterized peroxidase-related enzyme